MKVYVVYPEHDDFHIVRIFKFESWARSFVSDWNNEHDKFWEKLDYYEEELVCKK